jgi:hypothetical protein
MNFLGHVFGQKKIPFLVTQQDADVEISLKLFQELLWGKHTHDDTQHVVL